MEYDAGFESIFNYEYDCCAFAHNICGSKPKIPEGMSGTSEPLTPEFFVNPRCPPVAVPAEAGIVPKESVRERVEHSSTAGEKIGDNPDSLFGAVEEREDTEASDGS